MCATMRQSPTRYRHSEAAPGPLRGPFSRAPRPRGSSITPRAFAQKPRDAVGNLPVNPAQVPQRPGIEFNPPGQARTPPPPACRSATSLTGCRSDAVGRDTDPRARPGARGSPRERRRSWCARSLSQVDRGALRYRWGNLIASIIQAPVTCYTSIASTRTVIRSARGSPVRGAFTIDLPRTPGSPIGIS